MSKVNESDMWFEDDSIPTSLRTDAFLRAWSDWLSYRKEIRKKVTATSKRRQIKMLEEIGPAAAVAAIEQSIMNGWVGLFPPKGVVKNGSFDRSSQSAKDFWGLGGV